MLIFYSLKSTAKGRHGRKQEAGTGEGQVVLLFAGLLSMAGSLAFLYYPQPPTDIFTVEIPSSQITPACDSLTKKKKKKTTQHTEKEVLEALKLYQRCLLLSLTGRTIIRESLRQLHQSKSPLVFPGADILIQRC